MVPIRKVIEDLQQHCKVVWVYNGHSENVPVMYDKPLRLCRWWVKEHKHDSQFAKGQFCIVTLIEEPRTS